MTKTLVADNGRKSTKDVSEKKLKLVKGGDKDKKKEKKVITDPLKWDGVNLQKKTAVWMVWNRSEIPGLTPKDLNEQPYELKKCTFYQYHKSSKELSFDDGRVVKDADGDVDLDESYFFYIPLSEREMRVYPYTEAGKKKAQEFIDKIHERQSFLIQAATGGGPTGDQTCEETAREAQDRDELNTMAIALAGSDGVKSLKRASRAWEKKVQTIMALRKKYLENKGKKPLDRPSMRKVAG